MGHTLTLMPTTNCETSNPNRRKRKSQAHNFRSKSNPALLSHRSLIRSGLSVSAVLELSLMATSSLSSATYVQSFCHRRSLCPSQGINIVECNHSQAQVMRTNVPFWRLAANYVRIDCGVKKFSGKPIVVKQLWNRAGVIRCATVEEIQAHKSRVENDAKKKMEKSIEALRTNFNSVRTNRANPAILDRLEVEYYGTPVSLKSIAQITSPDASTILVSPYDKSSLKTIEKAILRSDLGLTPTNDGAVIRCSLPPLTSERRKELLRVVSKLAEDARVAIRLARRDALKVYEKLEKEKKLSEDNARDLSDDMQKLTDEYIKKVDSIYKQKEQEMMKI